MTVRLRGARIFFSTYPCSGRLKPNVRRHVQPGFYRVGKRFRIDDARDDYDREEINAPNRYGIPRFDIDRDQFIPEIPRDGWPPHRSGGPRDEARSRPGG